MKETRAELKEKIIDLENFFECAADELRKKTKFERFHFLVPDGKNGDFVTRHSTDCLNIRLTKKDMRVLGEDMEKDIIFSKTEFKRIGFFGRISFIKINWKIRSRGISAIMPIYSDGEIICLILFTDRLADDWLNKNSYYLNIIKQEIAHCLEAILLYNQTLERIIREYDRSDRRSTCRVDRLTDKKAPVLIGDKVDFKLFMSNNKDV